LFLLLQQRVFQPRGRSGSGSSIDLYANRNVSFTNSNANRVNSLRRNRSRGSLNLSSNGLNALGLGPVTLAPNVSSSSSGSVVDLTLPPGMTVGDVGGRGSGGSSSNIYASPSKSNLKSSLKSSSSTGQRGCALFLGVDGKFLCCNMKLGFFHHDPSTDGLQHLQQQLKGQKLSSGPKQVTVACCECVCGNGKSPRPGPDGEDNGGANYMKGYGGGYLLPATPKGKNLDRSSTLTSAELAASKNKDLQERQERQEKRGSVILERAFDFGELLQGILRYFINRLPFNTFLKRSII